MNEQIAVGGWMLGISIMLRLFEVKYKANSSFDATIIALIMIVWNITAWTLLWIGVCRLF